MGRANQPTAVNVVGFLAVAAATSFLCWFGLRSVLNRPPFLGTNYRGRSLCAVGGLPLVVAVVVVMAAARLIGGDDQ